MWLALLAFVVWRFIRRMDRVDELGRPEEPCVGSHLPRLHVSERGVSG